MNSLKIMGKKDKIILKKPLTKENLCGKIVELIKKVSSSPRPQGKRRRSIFFRIALVLCAPGKHRRRSLTFRRFYFVRGNRENSLGVFVIPKNEHMINEEIRDEKVRLISETGEQLGVMSAREAQLAARDAGLDLVKIAPNAVPPVCKIMDYGKYKFEQTKKQREARKNQNVVDTKEIKFRTAGVGDHDYDFRLRAALRYLEDGDKVKVTVQFRGREMTHTDLGIALLEKFAQGCAEKGVVEKPAKLEGRNMSLIIASKAGK